MNKLMIGTGIGALILLTGCQAIQDQTTSFSQQGEQTINGFSQQADNVRHQVLQTKAQFDQKSQEVINTVNDVNKVMK